jgi:hypothetical protein
VYGILSCGDDERGVPPHLSRNNETTGHEKLHGCMVPIGTNSDSISDYKSTLSSMHTSKNTIFYSCHKNQSN